MAQAEVLWLDGLRRKDAALLQCVLGDAFLDTSWQGQLLDRQQAIAASKTRTPFDQQVEITRARTFADTGVVWGVNRIIDRKSHQIVMRIRFTDVFRYEDGRWVAIAAQETPEKR